MAKFTKTETVDCPYCESDKVVKNGSYREGVQRYLCRGCTKQFSSTGVMHGRHIPTGTDRRCHQDVLLRHELQADSRDYGGHVRHVRTG